MKKCIVFLLWCSLALTGLGQTINVTFTGTGAATQIDSVTATSLSTGQRITLPGNETLILSVKTGIYNADELSGNGLVFPNPFSGTTTLMVEFRKFQSVSVKVMNLTGQVVAEQIVCVQPGGNKFRLSLSDPGIYWINLSSEEGTTGYKVISTASESENLIQYDGPAPGFEAAFSTSPELKTFNTGNILSYSFGNCIHMSCRSGVYTTVITDSPNADKNYEVEFASCTDPDGRNYSIVKIGDQAWMAENLAYLLNVGYSERNSITEPRYYVHGYKGADIVEAKGTVQYQTYGGLYNWAAAITACPAGWHLPSDEEWKELERFLGMNQSDLDGTDVRISGAVGHQLRETGTEHWKGTNPGSNNSTGFTALPGGQMAYNIGFTGFCDLGTESYLWSSTTYQTSGAWIRTLGSGYAGMDRHHLSRGEGLSVRCLQNN